MSLNIKELNTVSTFLLPQLALEPSKIKPRIINAYLYDEEVDKYKEGHISLVHSNYQDAFFKPFEEMLMKQEDFVDSYDIADSAYGVKVYKIHPKTMPAYECFVEGKYSKFDMIARLSCFKFGLLSNNSVLSYVFTKSEELKKKKEAALGIRLSPDSELWSKWSKEKDVLTPEIKEALRKQKLKPNNNFLNEH